MKRSVRILLRVLFWAYIAAVFYLCFAEFSDLSSAPRQIWGFPTDKVVHFGMFFPFPLLAYLAYGPCVEKGWKSLLFCVGLFLLGALVAAGTEFGQTFLPYRSGDLKDLYADLLALGISSCIVLIIDLIQVLRNAR